MKFSIVLAALASCAFAQQIHIKSPASGAKVKSGQFITLEIEQDQTNSSFNQTSIVIAAVGCNGNCNKPVPAEVMYSGAFKPEFNHSAPQKGHYQDFRLQLPTLPKGKAVIQVAHQFGIGARLMPMFEYTTLDVNVH